MYIFTFLAALFAIFFDKNFNGFIVCMLLTVLLGWVHMKMQAYSGWSPYDDKSTYEEPVYHKPVQPQKKKVEEEDFWEKQKKAGEEYERGWIEDWMDEHDC